ncbi:MAG: hypothetical protein JSS79_03820 [Bacteroidetes bacterium]|nr:hypothetical protein [Bacteroidota bacterium]
MTYFGKHCLVLAASLVLLSFVATAQVRKRGTDSLSSSVLVITPRFNSAGHFPFTGSLLNTNLNFDLNIFYERKRNGFFLFKSVDLVDPHSGVNYFQPGIFHRFEFSSKVQMRTFFGYLFSQTQGFRDNDSDYYTAASVYWAIRENLKVENTALFFDLSQSSKLADRLLVSYFNEGFKIDLYVWHRWEWASQSHATSASLAIGFPKIKITRSLSIANTISYQGYLSAEKPSYAMQKGLLISVAFPINVETNPKNRGRE